MGWSPIGTQRLERSLRHAPYLNILPPTCALQCDPLLLSPSSVLAILERASGLEGEGSRYVATEHRRFSVRARPSL